MNEVTIKESPFDTLKKIDERLTVIERKIDYYNTSKSYLQGLESKIEDNMQRLNKMMLELKGLIAMVRPAAAKNDWYKGEEISGTVINPTPTPSYEVGCTYTAVKQHINTSNGITFIEQ